MLQQASPSIGAIAAALAKAQTELLNPEKSIIATLSSPGEPERTFRYAPLSSGLDIIRKSLGRHEIATVQTTEIDEAGRICLRTVLVLAAVPHLRAGPIRCSSPPLRRAAGIRAQGQRRIHGPALPGASPSFA